MGIRDQQLCDSGDVPEPALGEAVAELCVRGKGRYQSEPGYCQDCDCGDDAAVWGWWEG